MKPTPEHVKQQAILLRTVERMSIRDIALRLRLGSTTTSRILRSYPLPQDETKRIWQAKVMGKRRELLKYDLAGQRFGRLIVLETDLTPHKRHEVYWRCMCDCGTEHSVAQSHLRRGVVRSCGCLGEELKRTRGCKSPEVVNLHAKYLLYRHASSTRNFEFGLTEEECWCLLTGNCFYCGTPPMREVSLHKNKRMSGREHGIMCNGIDRVDNAKGYIMGNCVSCCAFCNYAKRNHSQADFLAWLDRVSEYRTQGKEG